MTDLDLPPANPLPDGVRAAALMRLRAGFDAPPPRRLPLKVAAVVVAVATAVVVAVQLPDRSTEPATATDVPELPLPEPAQQYDVRTGSTPDGAVQRCRGQAAGEWTPIATASRLGVDLMAFQTAAGTVFCETTPTSVTVSAPQPDPRELTLAFTTATGSLAGFNGDDERPFTLARTREPGDRALAARFDRIFLAPNAFVPTGPVIAQPGITRSSELVQQFETVAPAPSTTVVDRPVAPEDRAGVGGRRLGECLADRSPPVVDPSAWRAGQAVALSAAESVQLGHYGDLLLVCHQDRTVQVHDLRRQRAVSGTTLRGVQVFHDFVDAEDNGSRYRSSNTVALIAVVTDPRVASVTVESPNNPDVTTEPVAGSVVLPGVTLDQAHPTRVRLVVRDAEGTVLEELRPDL